MPSENVQDCDTLAGTGVEGGMLQIAVSPCPSIEIKATMVVAMQALH